MGLCEIYNVFGCSHMPLEPKPCAELICKQHHVHEQEISSFPTETLQAPTPQNNQTHSNNLSAVADKLLESV